VTADIVWRLRLTSPPEHVFDIVATDEGRARFWAEETHEVLGVVHFRFLNGTTEQSPILVRDRPRRFAIRYFGAETTFELASDANGGCDLTLIARGVPAAEWEEVHAGWVSVLMTLKAAADHDIDLRSHDPQRSWDQGYVNQ
jgi:hypothetical protein